jgi:putative PIN family toxin of toxin-antitoxin system
MKVLFDTNVFISEALVGGLAERIIAASLQARWRAFASTYLLDEIERVLREKLGFSARVAALACQRARRRCEPADAPPSRHHVTADPKDSPILRTAIQAGVDYLVTDDHHLLNLHPYEGIRILSMHDFAALLRAEGLLAD